MPPTSLPSEPIDRIVGPLARFLHVEAASGVVLLAAAVAAFALANSPLADSFLGIWKTRVSFGFGGFQLDHSLQHWVSDGLMAIFFFVVGLEVKRELVLGQLRDMRKAALPIAAALGGMLVPAALYLLVEWGQPAARGWGIPMATDIAFVVGCMAILGPRVPPGLRILVLSLAIADDIGAIMVIAIGYTSDLNHLALSLGLIGIGTVLLLQRLGVRAIAVYVVVGILTWEAFHESGVHATIAGVVLGLLTPAHPWVSDNRLGRIVDQAGEIWNGEGWGRFGSPRELLQRVETAAREAVSPLVRLERGLHPWSAFLIMPIFALANAGVPFEGALLTDSVALAVGLGLVVGKPLGIFLFSYVAVRLGIARLPEGVSWLVLLGGGCLAGIGFTMSLFISGLALEGAVLDAAKVGVLVASLVSGAIGMALLLALLPERSSASGAKRK
ncbi:MAG: Na+/H+ antiporter NhaA [Myxococcota bacterium]